MSITQHNIRKTVMVSSTSKDLLEHRQAVMDAVRRMQMYPIVMEDLDAHPTHDAISASLKMVNDADIYIGIFGTRYGYVPNDARNPQSISITEMEYRQAEARGIPTLIFLMDDEHPVIARNVESNPQNIEKLNKLKAEFLNKKIVNFFKSPEDLRSDVISSLAKLPPRDTIISY